MTANVLISYTNSDRDWASWIAWELKLLGHRRHIHQREIKSGDDIHAWMEQHRDPTDYVLFVVSANCSRRPPSHSERGR